MAYYSAASSTYRKDDRISSRYQNKNELYTPRQELSETTRVLNYQRNTTILQQEQIADLQRKIDIILMHNEKLESEKDRYRLMFEQLQSQSPTERQGQINTGRFISEENQILVDRLRKQLEESSKTYENRLNEAFQGRKILKDEIQTLSNIIEQVNQQNRQLKLSIKQQTLKTESLAFDLKEQFLRQQIELQNKLNDQFLIRQLQLKNQKKDLMNTYEDQIKDLKVLFEQEKVELQLRNDDIFKQLAQDFNKDKDQLKKQLRQQFQKQKQSINEIHKNRLREEKDKATAFINQNMQSLRSNDNEIRAEYENQIEKLKDSLQKRKQLIDTILAQNSAQKQNGSSENSTQISWFSQLMALKNQLKDLTNNYLQESELLKLKLTQKFEIDIRELKKIYEDKIQLMSLHMQRLEEENCRLRDIYEKNIQTQIQNKKDYELEKSKLKNLIRKLRVELHGIQEEFKINIDGIKDQNNIFSMTMMKSMIEVKEKANFYSQQNRKLRKAYEEHENETIQAVSQAEQKANYYQSKYQSLKQRLNIVMNEYKQKIELIQLESEERQSKLRENLNKQHEMIHQIVEGLRKDVQQLTNENEVLRKKHHDIECTFKQKDSDIAFYKSKVDHLNADIERLKLDLQMAGVNDKDKTDTINQWRDHYERIVAQLQEEKKLLSEKVLQKDDQLTALIRKYKLLQYELQKVLKTFRKQSVLQKKILQVGLDNNLVNNMAELFYQITPFSQVKTAGLNDSQ